MLISTYNVIKQPHFYMWYQCCCGYSWSIEQHKFAVVFVLCCHLSYPRADLWLTFSTPSVKTHTKGKPYTTRGFISGPFSVSVWTFTSDYPTKSRNIDSSVVVNAERISRRVETQWSSFSGFCVLTDTIETQQGEFVYQEYCDYEYVNGWNKYLCVASVEKYKRNY